MVKTIRAGYRAHSFVGFAFRALRGGPQILAVEIRQVERGQAGAERSAKLRVLHEYCIAGVSQMIRSPTVAGIVGSLTPSDAVPRLFLRIEVRIAIEEMNTATAAEAEGEALP